MSAVTMMVKPLKGRKLVFLPMAPGEARGKSRGRAFLPLDVNNGTSGPLVLDTLTIS